MIWILLGLILAFILTGIFMSALECLCGTPNKTSSRTTRHFYKRFLSTLKDKDLYKHTFPKMSYEQIVNFYELPEANVEGCVMNSTMSRSARDDEDGVLILYVRKEDCLCPLEMWICNKYERENNGIILFVPKSYRDYKKLYDYFYNKGKKQKENEITNAQLESLQYLKDRIHESQDNSINTLKKCQEENNSITDRIELESSTNRLLNQVLNMDDCTEEIVRIAIKLIEQRNNEADKEMLERLCNKLVDIRLGKATKRLDLNKIKFHFSNPKY